VDGINEKEAKSVLILRDDNQKLFGKINKLADDKLKAEKKIYKLQSQLDNKLSVDHDAIDQLQNEISLLSNKIIDKDYNINALKKDIDKLVSFQDKDVKGELFITEPSKTNLDVNNEIFYTTDVIGKMTNILNEERQLYSSLEIQIEVYKI
jgi:predicted RNase H-like nuclease (RuvC/YqgF family)